MSARHATSPIELELEGRIGLVTGGNSGIGEAIVSKLGRAGMKMAINYVTDREAAEALASDLPDALAIHADVSDPHAVAAMFEQVDDHWGAIDVLVNNAGIEADPSPGWETDPSSWDQVLSVNLSGAFHCAREALRRMVPRGSGVVLNVSSVHEIVPWSGRAAYTASKAGLSMLTKTLAQEAGPYGVRVVAIAPGAIRTPINRAEVEDETKRERMLRKIPLGRIGETEDVATMAAVLVSDLAAYVTGSTVFVDGGMIDYPDFARGG